MASYIKTAFNDSAARQKEPPPTYSFLPQHMQLPADLLPQLEDKSTRVLLATDLGMDEQIGLVNQSEALKAFGITKVVFIHSNRQGIAPLQNTLDQAAAVKAFAQKTITQAQYDNTMHALVERRATLDNILLIDTTIAPTQQRLSALSKTGIAIEAIGVDPFWTNSATAFLQSKVPDMINASPQMVQKLQDPLLTDAGRVAIFEDFFKKYASRPLKKGDASLLEQAHNLARTEQKKGHDALIKAADPHGRTLFIGLDTIVQAVEADKALDKKFGDKFSFSAAITLGQDTPKTEKPLLRFPSHQAKMIVQQAEANDAVKEMQRNGKPWESFDILDQPPSEQKPSPARPAAPTR